MDLKPSMVETMRRLFYSAEDAPLDEPAIDRPARFRSLPPHATSRPIEDQHSAAPVPRSKLEEDPFVLWQETEFFGTPAPHNASETQQRPIIVHLCVISGIAWLFTIDPVFQALTPRNFSGVPAPQLLAVFFIFPLIFGALMWTWARVLGPHARVFVRTQCNYWKRWLAAAFVLFISRSWLG